jgi:hypothetical protein
MEGSVTSVLVHILDGRRGGASKGLLTGSRFLGDV